MLGLARDLRASRRAFSIIAAALGAGSALVISILGACSLTASPGDYAQGGGVDAAPNVSPPPLPPGGTRVLLLAAQRPTFRPNDDARIQETVSAIVRADGSVGDFFFDRAPPLLTGAYGQALVDHGNVILLANSSPAVAFAPLDPDSGALGADWSAMLPDGSIQGLATTFVVPPSLLVAAGGFVEVPVDGGTTTEYNGNVFTATIDVAKRTAGAFVPSPASLVGARGQARLVVSGAHLFAVGGRRDDVVVDDVEVAHLGEGGKPDAFVATARLPLPVRPEVTVGGNRLFSVGGLIDRFHPTDRVFAAVIHDDDGRLEPWTTLPALPVALALGGAVFVNGKLYYFGGLSEVPDGDAGPLAVAVPTVYVLDVDANGSRWTVAGNLPAPRAGLAVTVMP
ncbi:MAG TPA: kelch repeat-containing protein [Polyangiaceae bacterium]|nr:kelch repeat-containing protein [Polyangiaceae bacterium]